MFFPCGESVPDLTNFTLLMPAVSVGNVGQLAIDLIISTLNMCKIGYFYTDCLVPIVGNNPYATEEENSDELSINTEVYSLPSRKLVVLQLRSIFIKYKSKSFCEKLLAWVGSSGCARVIVLWSSHSYHRNDVQLRSTPFRYLLTPCLQKSVQNKIKSLNWVEMEKSRCIPEMSDSESCIRIPGGGITKTLNDESCSKEIQMAVLLKFVSEGDNIPDAVSLVEYLNEWLQIIKPCVSFTISDSPMAALPWKIPSSWRLLVGSGLPPALFCCFQFLPRPTEITKPVVGCVLDRNLCCWGCVRNAIIKPRGKEVVEVVMFVIYNTCKFCTINFYFLSKKKKKKKERKK